MWLQSTKAKPALRRPGPEAVGVTVLLGLAFLFYLWIGSSSGNPIKFNQGSQDRYNLLSDALLNGRASLEVEPPEGLLALPNPYDPQANAGFRSGLVHDLSLYQDRFYMYWGPTPAVTLFVPFRALPLGDMPENLAVVLFAFGGLLFSVALLRFLVRRFVPDTPVWMLLVGVGALALTNVAPFALRRPAVYEVAIAAGFCFLFAGLFFLVTGLVRDRPSLVRLALGSSCLGLAVGARSPLGLAGLLLVAALIYVVRSGGLRSMQERAQPGLALLGPFLMCIVLLAVYNQVRFDSVTEFGLRYQLAGVEVAKKDAFNPAYLAPGLWYYALAPARLSLLFPYIFLPPPPGYPGTLPEGYDGVEMTGGVLSTMPIVVFLVALPMLWRARALPGLRWVGGAMAGLGLLLMVFLAFTLWGVSERYAMDFATLLVVPALLCWFALATRQRSQMRRRALALSGTLLALWGGLVGAAISFVGYDPNLLRSNQPGTHETLERLTSPLPTLAATVAGHPVMTEVVNPSGVEGPPLDYASFEVRDLSFWMELNPTIVKVVSPGKERAFLRATLKRGPNLRPGADVAVIVESPDTGSVQRVPVTNTEARIPLELDGGLNRVELRLSVEPPPPRQPGDPIAGQVVRVDGLELDATD